MERQLSDIFISSNLQQALPRHRHDDGAARGDYSTAVFCILPARLSCSACSVLKTVPHWNPLFATRVFHPGIFGIHKIPVYIRVLLHSRVGLTTMSCTRVFCLILAETHEYYSAVPFILYLVRFCSPKPCKQYYS